MNHLYRCFILSAAALLSGNIYAREGTLPVAKQQTKSPLCFIENKGQVIDQYNHSRMDIDYKIKTPGMSVFIGDAAIHYQWVKQEALPAEEMTPEKMSKNGPPKAGKADLYRMDVSLVGANKNALVIQNESNDYYENYYTEPIGLKGAVAHSFKRITYKDVYPHIDWVLYINNGALKYDFVVHPGGNVKDIQLKYGGATKLEMKQGALAATTPMGSITEHKPYSYDAATNQEIPSSFALNESVLSFNINGTTSADLVIDPQMDWATYYGGSNAEYSYGDGDDGTNVYITGWTNSTSNIATSGAYQTSLNSSSSNAYDAFLAKFSPSGSLLWATYYGGSYYDWGHGVACDPTGNVYMSGSTGSTTNIATTGAHQTTYGGPSTASYGDDFLAKFSSSGSLLWATYYGGSSNEQYGHVACDLSGNVFLSGWTNSSNDIATSGSYQSSLSGNDDCYIAKFNSSGVRQWGTYYGGSNQEDSWGSACDPSGNVIICGWTYSTSGIATSGAHQTSLSGSYDAFIAKFTSSGSISWGTYFGGSSNEYAYDVATDASGNIFAVGWTYSTNGIATTGAYQTVLNNSTSSLYDGFITKFNSSGTQQWGTYYGDAGQEYMWGVDIGANGYVYCSGWTNSTSGIATPGAYQTVNGGSNDAMFVEFTNSGTRMYATYFGGSNIEYGYGGVACTPAAVYFSGWTYSSSNIATTGAYQTSLGGTYDAFLAKFLIDTLPVVKQPFTDTALCAGDTLRLQFDVSYKFRSTNVFTAQLSNASGSFASPVNIGTLATDTAGTIVCIIPPGTPTGAGYRVRIVATNPVRISSDNGKNIGIGNSLAKPVASSNSPVCSGSDLNLFGSTTTSSTAIQWSWTGPNSFTSNLQNPTITSPTAASAGNYILTAQLYGCKGKDTTSVTVIALPAPSGIIATSNSPVCENDTLRLYSTNSSTGSVYSWTGPNSFSANTQNTTIIHPTSAAAGDYIVSATLNGCSVKDTVSIIVKPVSVSFTATDNSPVCAGGTYSMNASSTSTGVVFTWAGPNSFSAGIPNPSLSGVTSSNAGNYIVTATLNGCSLRDTLTLVVNPLPAKPVAGSNTPVCTGTSLNLTASTTTTGVGYTWVGPNSFSSSTQNPSINNVTIAAGGDYVVTATITATGCIAKDTETVVVRPTPIVNAFNNTPICEGGTVNISSTATPTGAFSWTGPNSYTSSVQNPAITNASPNASGDYIVAVTLNGCTGKDTTTVTVKPNPIMPVTGSNSPVCIGATLNLTAASNAGATYSWTGPNTFSSTLQNPTKTNATTNDAGNYSVIATLNGCVSPAGSTTVVVNPVPFVVIYPTPGDSICQGNTVTFIALPANASANPTYKWTRNSSPSVLSTTNTLISTSINNNDVIRCEMTEPSKCGSAYKDTSNEVKMTVLPYLAPSVSITSNPTTPLSPNELITFTALPVNGGNNPKFQWKINNADQVGATNITWATQQLSNNDSVSVIMTSDYRCPQPTTATSNKIKVTVLTGVSNVKGGTNMQLYPNPNSGRFTVHGNTMLKNGTAELQIMNAVGQLVYKTTAEIKGGELETVINLSEMANGTYLLKLKAGEQTDAIRFTISR